MRYISDYDIQALIDDELNHDDANRVLMHIKQTPNAQKRYQQIMKQKNAIKSWWKDLSVN